MVLAGQWSVELCGAGQSVEPGPAGSAVCMIVGETLLGLSFDLCHVFVALVDYQAA